MAVERLAALVGTADWHQSFAFLRRLLGEPTVVEEGTWAQFDRGGSRVCLAPLDQAAEGVSLMVKVADVAAAREHFAEQHCEVSEVELGVHEERVEVVTPEGIRLVVYRPV